MAEVKIQASPSADYESLQQLMREVDVEYEKFHGQGIKKHSVDLRSALLGLTKVAKSLRKSTQDKRKSMVVERNVAFKQQKKAML